jgi:hypothetical protein
MSNEVDPDNPVKEYTGVWIPKAVMECDLLSPIDKIVYGEIACFEECYGSNEWLAKRIGRSVSTASRCVSKLIDLGFVEPCGFNGRFRAIRIVKNCKPTQKCLGRLRKNDKAAYAKMPNIDKSIDKSIDIESKDSIEELPLKVDKRNPNIDEAFAIWEEVMGYQLHQTTKERFSVNSILRRKDMSLDKLRVLIRLVEASQHDKYKRFSISSFTDLMYKTNDLMAWAREKQAQQQTNSELMEV